MRSSGSKRYCRMVILLMICFLTPVTSVLASGTIVKNIRLGRHLGFTRIVFDCIGEKPEPIGPVHTGFIGVFFANPLDIPAIEKLSSRLHDEVDRIEILKSENNTEMRLSSKIPGARIKPMILASDTQLGNNYRLVLDIYPDQPVKAYPAVIASTPAPQPQPSGAVTSTPTVAATPALAAAAVPVEEIDDSGPIPSASKPEASMQPHLVEHKQVATEQADPDSDEISSNWVVAAEGSLILRSADVEGSSAKFDQYRDITRPVSGDLKLAAEKDRDYYLQGKAIHIGQDDQYLGAEGGRYGKYGIDASWDKIIHRYATDARTLYSGVGSGYMRLDDNLQANVQAAPNAVEVANRLNGFLTSAVTGDPSTTRDQRQLGFNLVAFDPFSLRLNLANEKREGTRPYAGAFSNAEMVELFEPIDYDTTGVKISGEYAQAPFFLNVAYEYSQFENKVDTLRFDNPLRATDAVGGPSNGTIDLAPDNQYHNLAVSGALTHLPWRSQITANAAWGRMTQDDMLVPYTSNTAINPPALPTDRVDAQVDTSLYNLRFSSKPLAFMRVKGNLRYYDYDNRTGVIDFPDGYVETDAALVSTPIRNLPSSYTKTRAGGEVGFDVFTRANLNLGYTYEKTERENREVGLQEDHIIKASLDTRALDWLDIRTLYEHTQRDIEDYRFDVYLDSGKDLEQLPQLRKYDQADLMRDLIQLTATAYPTDNLVLSGSAAYGVDDFHNSPYGLIEDSRYVFSFDSDYTLGERLTLNLFYTHEIYENEQRGRQIGGANDFDWNANGDDRVDTIGGGIRLALIPTHLDLDLVYAYSDVDGNLDFSSPSGSFADFSAVDDTQTHWLNTKLIYHNDLGFDVTVGYLWEKFDYTDFAAEGFTHVPTDTIGNYQGALLSGTLPQDYDAHVIYTRFTFRYH